MVKRKKRLEKQIESLQAQELIHIEKREQALKEGKFELAGYFAKEIVGMKNKRENKGDKLKKLKKKRR
ncbi:MAG: hypothetical protein AABW80_03935 [Nanoarchaeota archaeon]